MFTTSQGMQFASKLAQKSASSVIVPTVCVPVHPAKASEKYSFGSFLPTEMFTPVLNMHSLPLDYKNSCRCIHYPAVLLREYVMDISGYRYKIIDLGTVR